MNYGYSLILSAFNREIVACGFLTQLGIGHHNAFNHYNLSLREDYPSLADKLLGYMELMTSNGLAEVFVFVNLRSFLMTI